MNELLSDLPVRVTRREGAELVSRYFFSVDHRTLERWPLGWRRLNGKAHVDTKELFEYAAARVAETPVVPNPKAVGKKWMRRVVGMIGD